MDIHLFPLCITTDDEVLELVAKPHITRFWILAFIFLVMLIDSANCQTNMRLGDTATCSLQNDSTIKCWGDSAYCDPSYNGTGGYIYEPPTDGFDLGDTDGVFTAMEISVGSHHVCALSDDGKGRCWGNNGLFMFCHCIFTVHFGKL